MAAVMLGHATGPRAPSRGHKTGAGAGRSQHRWIAAIAAAALLAPSLVRAQDLAGSFGDWILMADDTTTLALTTDGTDSAFGVICGPDCYVYIETRDSCIEGRAYPARIEAGGTGFSAMMECRFAEGERLLVMPLEERLLKLIAGKESLGIAVERDAGASSHYHFPLAGSAPAIGLALAARDYIRPGASSTLGALADPVDPGSFE